MTGSIDEAHAVILRDQAFQFDLKPRQAEPIPATVWHWSSLDVTAAVWVIVGVGALIITFLAARTLLKRPKVPSGVAAPDVPSASALFPLVTTRLALGDADALAASGLFLEGAHVLLTCGVSEIARRFPATLVPTTTSRDIAMMTSLPEPIRSAFGHIAGVVELGLFGGRPLDKDHYAECRKVFVASALAGAM